MDVQSVLNADNRVAPNVEGTKYKSVSGSQKTNLSAHPVHHHKRELIGGMKEGEQRGITIGKEQAGKEVAREIAELKAEVERLKKQAQS